MGVRFSTSIMMWEAKSERVGAEAPQDEEMAGIAEEILRIGAARHMGFRQRDPGGAQHDGAEACKQPEAGAPGCILFEEAAEHGGNHRGHDKGHGDVGNHAGGFFTGKDIAHHGAGQHDASGAADGLDEPCGNQGFDGGGAMAASTLATKKSERPARSMGRRPNLSEAGP